MMESSITSSTRMRQVIRARGYKSGNWFETPRYPCRLQSTEIVSAGKETQEQARGGHELATVILPSKTELSTAAEDLLRRLLQPDPQLRLRSIFGLQRIAFYMGQEIRNYKAKEISPLTLLGRKTRQPSNSNSTLSDQQSFSHFDSFVAGSTNRKWDFTDKL